MISDYEISRGEEFLREVRDMKERMDDNFYVKLSKKQRAEIDALKVTIKGMSQELGDAKLKIAQQAVEIGQLLKVVDND